jgi:hypothetical protein
MDGCMYGLEMLSGRDHAKPVEKNGADWPSTVNLNLSG